MNIFLPEYATIIGKSAVNVHKSSVGKKSLIFSGSLGDNVFKFKINSNWEMMYAGDVKKNKNMNTIKLMKNVFKKKKRWDSLRFSQ